MPSNLLHVIAMCVAWLCGLAATLPAISATAVDSFRIRQLASSQDGFEQIIELEEVSGKDGQDRFAGLTLTATNRHGITKTFVFPSDLPNAGTANKRVTIGPQPYMDFILPPRFLPTDGGTLDFAGVDRWDFDAIPTDGGLLARDGKAGLGQVQAFAGKVTSCCGPFYADSTSASFGLDLTLTTILPYYNESLGHYFISGSQPDIDALESGRIPGWRSTGNLPTADWFVASGTPTVYRDGTRVVHSVPVCRFHIPPGSHFISAFADECDKIARQYPEFVLETPAAFYAVLPDIATGECPPDIGGYGPAIAIFTPVYRLWNHRLDTNHRFTASLTVRAQMIEKGWISEGYGPLGVAMCGTYWF